MAAPKTFEKRINWKLPHHIKLARATAELLVEGGKGDNFTDKDMMQAFRSVQDTILEPNERRDIRGPVQVPWLRGMVETAIINLLDEKTKPSDVIPFTMNEPPPPEDTTELIVDLLSNLENKLNEFVSHLESFTRVQEVQTAAIKALIDTIEGKKADSESAIMHVTVVGIIRDVQRMEIIHNIMDLGKKVRVSFDMGNDTIDQLPYFDYVIMTYGTSVVWRQSALRLFPQKVYETNSIDAVAEEIKKLHSQWHTKVKSLPYVPGVL